jgi:hypothetical protein
MHAIRHIFRFTIVLLAALLAPGQIALSGVNETIPQDNLGGKTLMTFCDGKTDTDAGICNGYILGIAEAMTAGQMMYGQKSCNTDGIKAQQLSDLIRMTLDENPKLQSQKAGPMVAGVLAKAYPCYDDYAPASGDNSIQVERLPAR